MTPTPSFAVLLAAAVLFSATASPAAASRPQDAAAAARFAAATARRGELHLPPNRWLQAPGADAVPAAPTPPDDLALAEEALQVLDGADVALRQAAEAQLATLLERPDRSPHVVQLVLATAATCWPEDPTELAVPAADGSPSYAARVVAAAARTGDRAFVQRILASAGAPPDGAPGERVARAHRYADVVLRYLALAAPHVDAELARELHARYAPILARRTDGAILVLTPAEAGASDVLFGIYPNVPDDLIAWYEDLLRSAQMRREGLYRLRGALDRLDERRIVALLDAERPWVEPQWLARAPHLVADLLRGDDEAARCVLDALQAVPPKQLAEAQWVALCRVFAELPVARSAPFLHWVARLDDVPLIARLAAFPAAVAAQGGSQDLRDSLGTAIVKRADATDEELAALAPVRQSADPVLANIAWSRTLEFALMRGRPVDDAEAGIALVGARQMVAMAYALRFLDREPTQHLDRLMLLDHRLAEVDVERLRAWHQGSSDLASLVLRARHSVTRANLLRLVGERPEWPANWGKVIALVLAMAEQPEVRAAAYRALATRDVAQVPEAALVAEAEFDVDPLVRAVTRR